MAYDDEAWRTHARVKPPQQYKPEFMEALNQVFIVPGELIHLGYAETKENADTQLNDFRAFMRSFKHFAGAFPQTYEALSYYNVCASKRLKKDLGVYELRIQAVRHKPDLVGLAQRAILLSERERYLAGVKSPQN